MLSTYGTPRNVFNTENLVVLPLWLGVILAPSSSVTKNVMSSYLPVLLAIAAYCWLTYLAFQDPVSLEGFKTGISDLTGLTKVRQWVVWRKGRRS